MDTEIEPGEKWWGGAVQLGAAMPFGAETALDIDLMAETYGNPAVPMLLSSHGRWLHSGAPFHLKVAGGVVSANGPDIEIQAGAGEPATLRSAFLACRDRFFPPSGRAPADVFFTAPQWNTWIELQYNQNERDILAYARAIVDNGFQPGILTIDDTWQFGYGTWEFDPRRFHDPRGMCSALHDLGFKVMLWACPFVSADSPAYRELERAGGLVAGDDGSPATVRWWNGQSALLDFTHPNAMRWFEAQLGRLAAEFGVDGFKLDAGDLCYWDGANRRRHLAPVRLHSPGALPQDAAEAYGAVGLRLKMCEYRTAWGHRGEPIALRLADKRHSWDDLARLIPDMAAMGLAGYPFVCPDMVGGGNFVSFLPGAEDFDQELFVRSAQVHALSPMMQFSAAPWRVLDSSHLAAVKAAAGLRSRFARRFAALAHDCAASGEPMLRNLEYAFPRLGYADIRDQFMMGDFLLVAPQTRKGATSRTAAVPPGRWMCDDGGTVCGPAEISLQTPIDRIPFFERLP